MDKDIKNFSFKSLFLPLTTLKAIHIIIVVGFLVFFNTLFNGFVWDDFLLLQTKPLLIWEYFGKNLLNTGGQYRPITSLYFSLMFSVFKDAPLFYHFFAIGIHIINSILVFLLFKRFFKISLSLFLALLFVVHPMQVESASFIATSGNMFFFLFGISGLLISVNDKLSLKQIICICILLTLSLLSKETGILFIGMALAYQLIQRRVQPVILANILMIPVLSYSFLRFIIAQIYLVPHSQVIPIAQLSLVQRVINIPVIFFYYLKTFLFPQQLVIMQFWVITRVDSYFYIQLGVDLLFIVFMLITGYYLYTNQKKIFHYYVFYIAWFFAGLFMHIQIFPLDMTVADRWFYFPMVGLLGMFGIGLQVIIKKYKPIAQIKPVLFTLGLTILLLLSLRTIIRNSDWHDHLTLFTHDSLIMDNFIIENNIGWSYKNIGNNTEALKHFKKSVELYPYATNLFNTAATYILVKDVPEARKYFFRVLDSHDYLETNYKQALSLSAWQMLLYDSPETAKSFIEKALQKEPDNGFLWADLAICEYKLDYQEKALKYAEKARTLSSTPAINYLYSLIKDHKEIPKNINIVSQ